MQPARERLTALVLGISLAALPVFSVAAYLTVTAFQRSRVELMRTRERLRNAEQIVSVLRHAVGEMRGFVITGNEEYVRDIPEAMEELRRRLTTLGEATDTNGRGRALATRLEPKLEERLEGLRQAIDFRRQRGRDAAETYLGGRQGRKLDSEIAVAVDAYGQEESREIAQRIARVDAHARTTFALLGSAVLGNLILVVAVIVILRRELRKREAIAERLEAEAAQSTAAAAELRQSRMLFQRLFEDSPDAMVLVDADRRITRANGRASAVFGWPEKQLEGALLDELLPERFRTRHVAHMAAYFQAPRARPMGQGLELLGLRRSGEEFPVDILLSPMELEGGVQALAVIRDITQRKKAQQHIEQLNEDLQRRAADLEYANKELEAFSYSVSHDLRAPLRHVNGFADMLRGHAAGMLDDKGRRYLDTIVEAARRMGVLIDDLLMFSRMGRTEMVRQSVNLSVLVDEAKQAVEREAAGRAISWKVEPLPEVKGDVAMLRQVLFNLVSNAVKYTRDRPEAVIEIGTVPGEPGEVVCFVKDNGAGFDMKYAHKLFGVFQRLHGSAEFEGTGVGLAIVRRILQRHGGRVWAEAAVGRGATFFFSLPTAVS